MHVGRPRPRPTPLAAWAGLSRSQFCLLFRRGTGRSPQVYMEERRLEMAAHYLRATDNERYAELIKRLNIRK